MCDCYKIGGPWIAEDPSCPIHGVQAQQEREEAEHTNKNIEDRLNSLEEKLNEAMRRIQNLERKQRSEK